MTETDLEILTTREASILAISLGGIVISIGSLSLFTDPSFGRHAFAIGYFSAWFGWFYREVTILQTSIGGNMVHNHDPDIRHLGLIRSVAIRFAQVIPMILWVWVAMPLFTPMNPLIGSLIVFISGYLIVIAPMLGWIESKYLWLDTPTKTSRNPYENI